MDMQAMRVLLLERRAALLLLMEDGVAATRPVELDQASIGRLSRMDAMQGQQMAQEAVRRRKLELTRIDGALRRIDSGEFGDCYLCGEEIDVRRLLADPAHTRCIRCADRE